MGYYDAGFCVVGVDIAPQPHYPFEFVLGDALEYVEQHGRDFDLIHASPPCQRYSTATPPQYKANHPDLIAQTRRLLKQTGRPYVIENVTGARGLLIEPIMLCGTMFDMKIFRHRYFETFPTVLIATPRCRHDFTPVLITGQGWKDGRHRRAARIDEKRTACGIDWMTCDEITESIPPCYTEKLGRILIQEITAMQ